MRRYSFIILMIFTFLAILSVGCSDSKEEKYTPQGRKKFVKHSDTGVLAAVISPKSYYVIIGTKDKFPSLWGLVQQAELYKFDAAYALDAKLFAFNDDSRFAAIAADKYITLWNVESGRKLEEFKVPHKITALDLNRNARFTLAGTDAGIAYFILSTSGKTVREFHHGASIVAASITPDGEFVGTLGDNNVFKLWRVSSGKRVFYIRPETQPSQMLLDNNYIFMASSQGDMVLWSAVNGQKIFKLNKKKTTVSASKMASKEKILVTVNMPNEVNVWNMRDGKLIASEKLRGFSRWTQGQRYALSVAFSENLSEIYVEDANGIGEIVVMPELERFRMRIRKDYGLEKKEKKQKALRVIQSLKSSIDSDKLK